MLLVKNRSSLNSIISLIMAKNKPSKNSSCWKRPEDVLKTSFVFVFRRRIQDIFKTSSRRFQDIFKRFPRRHPQDALLRCFQDVLQKCFQDIFNTPSRRFEEVIKTSSRHLQDVLQRCLQDVFKTYYQVKLFLLTRLRDIFKTCLRSTPKTVIDRRICLGHTSEKFMVSVQNLQE